MRGGKGGKYGGVGNAKSATYRSVKTLNGSNPTRTSKNVAVDASAMQFMHSHPFSWPCEYPTVWRVVLAAWSIAGSNVGSNLDRRPSYLVDGAETDCLQNLIDRCTVSIEDDLPENS
jgi:hypothetical protein